MENNGWLDLPWVAFPPSCPPLTMSSLLKHLLYLAQAHQGMLSTMWVKAHAGHHLNKVADKAAKAALTSTNSIDLPSLRTPPGWVDTAPSLGGKSLVSLTRCIIRDCTTPPLSEPRCAPFLTEWATHMLGMSGLTLDARLHAPHVWKLNVPPRLRKLLWKDMTGSLPIGHSWHGNMEQGRTCQCSTTLSLTHVWTGCRLHALLPLIHELQSHLPAPPGWAPPWGHPWFPLLALKELESTCLVGKKEAKRLKANRPDREWVIGSYLWLVWTNKMREVHSEGYAPPRKLRKALQAMLATPPNLRPPGRADASRQPHHTTMRDPSAKSQPTTGVGNARELGDAAGAHPNPAPPWWAQGGR